MHGHECHFVGYVVLFCCVYNAQERYVLKIIVQGKSILGALCLIPTVFHKRGYGIDKLLHVGQTRLPFYGQICLIKCEDARTVCNLSCKHESVCIMDFAAE